MGVKHLTWFKVENFKRFDSLEVNDIGQFNLIVGDNNVGKTSLLEALTFDDDNHVNFLSNMFLILDKKNIKKIREQLSILNFFNLNGDRKITYHVIYTGERANSLTVQKRSRSSLSEDDIKLYANQLNLYNNSIFFEFSSDNKRQIVFLEEIDSPSYYYPYISFGDTYDSDLVGFFSIYSVSATWLENFKKVFKEFIPNLTSIEVSSAYTANPMIILREQNIDNAILLSQYGDGFIKFFRCLLEIEMCENRRLMVDEIDSGIHYSRMKDFLKKVLQNAKNKQVQLFATTHSKECMEYYKQALEELGFEKDGRVIKIADTKSGIKSFTYEFEQFENALLAGSEIR